MTIQSVPILGFQPDLPPTTPGVLTYTAGVLPTPRGIGNGVSVQSVSTAVSGPSLGGAEIVKIDGTVRQFMGVSDKLYEIVGGVATDRSAKGYSATTDQPWSFAHGFGDTTFAANLGDVLQASTVGVFADACVTAPRGYIVVTAGGPNRAFAMLFGYNDGANTYRDGIWWSPTPRTTWTPSIESQIGNVRITDVNGAWTAAIAYRDGVLAFKANAMYLGNRVGGSDQWAWTRISDTVGCMGPNAVAAGDDVVYFANDHGLWVFDGSYPQRMPGAIHDWWARNASAPYVRLTWDHVHHLLWVGYTISSLLTYYLAFNALSGLWTNYGVLAGAAGGMRDLITGAWGVGGGTTQTLSVTHTSVLAQPATFRLAPVGSDYQTTLVRSIQPQWLQGPSDAAVAWASGKVYHGSTLRNVLNQYEALAFDPPGRFNVVMSDFWLQPEISLIGGTTWECGSIAADISPGGTL